MTILTAAELAEIRKKAASGDYMEEDQCPADANDPCGSYFVSDDPERLLRHIDSLLSPSAPGVEERDALIAGAVHLEQNADEVELGATFNKQRDASVCGEWRGHAATLRSLASRLAAPAGDGWIPCGERMPSRDGYYEVASSEPYPPQVYILECRDTAWPEHAHWRATGDFHGHVTHWREPLAPPSGAKGE